MYFQKTCVLSKELRKKEKLMLSYCIGIYRLILKLGKIDILSISK